VDLDAEVPPPQRNQRNIPVIELIGKFQKLSCYKVSVIIVIIIITVIIFLDDDNDAQDNFDEVLSPADEAIFTPGKFLKNRAGETNI
jgi:hypothetical protein